MRAIFTIKVLISLFWALPAWSSAPFSASGNARLIDSIVREALQNPNAGVGLPPGQATQCTLCHSNPPTLNTGFGTHFRQALLVVGAQNPPNTSQAQMVLAVQNDTFEGTDSDGDGFTNLQEFTANRNPNDPNSRPNAGTTTTTTRIATPPPPPPVGGVAPAQLTNDPDANKLSGGCSGGGQASIEDPHRGTRAKVWFALCLFPFLAGLVTRRYK